MKTIMISIKPEWCAKIMNGEKTIEVRKNKALASAIKKEIDENGYVEIYVYCSKDKKYANLVNRGGFITGMVAFKFRCYKVEEIIDYGSCYLINKNYPHTNKVAKQSCLDFIDLKNYLKGKNGYAIFISDLEIFDKPKELREFWTVGKHCKHKNKPDKDMYCDFCYHYDCIGNNFTKAPQNFYYVEVE